VIVGLLVVAITGVPVVAGVNVNVCEAVEADQVRLVGENVPLEPFETNGVIVPV
jgi:hypothetical protein